MLTRCMARTVSIVGAGRVGQTLAKRLHALGWSIGAVVTQSNATARSAVRFIGSGTPCAAPAGGLSRKTFRGPELQLGYSSQSKRGALTPEKNAFTRALEADVVIISTPDKSIAGVAKSLAVMCDAACRDKIVLHTSGALDSKVLAPLAKCGVSTGSLHPMQTFSGRNEPNLKNVIFTIEGDRRAVSAARKIARQLGGIPVVIKGRDKPAYHATAVLVAGSGFPLIESATRILTSIGFSKRRALQTLLPLTRQMLDNVERVGPRAAWTGPASRGDWDVIAMHRKALRRYPRELQQAYAALALLSGKMLAKNPSAAMRQIKRALK